MRSSIASKLVLLLTTTLVAAFSLQSIILIQRETALGRENIMANAKTFASLSVGEIIKNYNIYYDSGFYKFCEIINKLFGRNTDLAKIKILNMNGEILFDSEEVYKGKYEGQGGLARTVEDRELPEIRDLNRSSRSIKESGIDYFKVTNPYVEEWGGHYYTVEYYFTFLSLEKNIRQIILNSIVLMSSFCVAIIIFIFLFSNKIIVRPLKKIVGAANAFGQGNSDYEIKVKSNDEIGELANNLNRIFLDLKKSKAELEDYAKNLETKIKERTKELELKNIEQTKVNEKLEHMNKLMVGRELRMVELKKEIEILKKQERPEK
jgi:methyl-accepting chemotaxis protein